MKNSKNKKIIFLSMISFLTITLSLLIKSNITYGSEENVYYFADLKEGDYLPYNQTIKTEDNYYERRHYICNPIYYYYSNSVRVIYLNTNVDSNLLSNNLIMKHNSSRSGNFKIYEGFLEYDNANYFADGDGKYYGEEIATPSEFQIKKYDDIFSNDTTNKYIGWEIKKISENAIILVPTTNYSKINETPSLNNNYNINTTILDTEESDINNKWYLIKDITTYETNDSTFWQNDNNVMHFLYKGDREVGDTYTLTYTFEAKTGDILTFNSKSWSGASYYTGDEDGYSEKYDTYEIKFNNQILSYPTNYSVDYDTYDNGKVKYVTGSQDSALYENINIEVTKSGIQTLSFTYTINGKTVAPTGISTTDGYITERYSYNYAYVKGVSLLTPINEGKQLDTSKVKNGDEVIYRSTSQTTGYVLSERLTYSDGYTANEEENPNTGKFISIITLITLMILLMVLIKYYPKKVKINKI